MIHWIETISSDNTLNWSLSRTTVWTVFTKKKRPNSLSYRKRN